MSETKAAKITGIATIIAAFIGLIGVIIGRQTAPVPEIHIYNSQNQKVAVTPEVAEERYNELIKSFQDITSKLSEAHNRLSQLEAENAELKLSLHAKNSNKPISTKSLSQGNDHSASNNDMQQNTISLPVKLQVFNATASSEKYPALNAVDGETSGSTWLNRWITNADDLVGAWIKLDLPEPKVLSSIRIFMAIKDQWSGCQIRDAIIYFSDGSSQNVRFPFENGWQKIQFSETRTEFVKIEVQSIYPSNGSWTNSMDIYEIELYGI